MAVNKKASLVYRTTQNKKERKITKNEKPLSKVSPRRQLVHVGGSILWWKIFVKKASFEPGMK